MTTDTERDRAARLAAFRWLDSATQLHGDVLQYDLLHKGFEFDGETFHFLGAKGIFKPRQMKLPLSITTSPKGPYHDSFSPDGLLAYRYRGTDPAHPDNCGLCTAMAQQLPLIYFHGIVPGRYLTVWPVYVMSDDQAALTFRVAVDDAAYAGQPMQRALADDRVTARRIYVTSTVRLRLHQRSFREKVIAAYRSQCSLCRLKHSELLDAAHITSYGESEGDPSVTNGIALCKLHHAAFDSFIIGVAPDYSIHVRRDVLEESDGPILKHGLQLLDGGRLTLPRSRDQWPDREKLALRYERFRAAA
jgi:putative restriction endonuclease